jgi:hypothetical protein
MIFQDCLLDSQIAALERRHEGAMSIAFAGVGNSDQVTPIQRRRRFPPRSIVLYAPRELTIGGVVSGGAPVEMSGLHTQES